MFMSRNSRPSAQTGQLDNEDFDSFITADPVDDLLTWLADPKGTRQRWDTARWETLCSRCKSDYGFDPVSDGELVGGEMLGLQKKTVWQTAWKRFAAVPTRYAGLGDLLRKAKPESGKGDLLASIREESWPQDNEADEQELRQALAGLRVVPVAEARANIIALGKSHKPRRAWVWAKLGQTPLAHAIKHLGALAESTLEPLTGESIDGMIGTYTESGWRADAAMVDSLASVSHHDDRQAVCAAIEHIYTPWLRDAAELFQQRFKAQPLPGRSQPRLDEVTDGTCVLFADGLRFDVGQKLNDLLKGRVEKVELSHQAVALPSVTPTSKPAVSPVADKINGVTAGEEFRPSVAETGKDLTTDRFRKLLEEAGFQVLGSLDIGNPEGRAWTEYGNLDQTGHKEGIGLASRVQELLRGLAARIESLLAAGWREVGSCHRSRLAACARRTTQGRITQVPDGNSMGTMCGGQAFRHSGLDVLFVVLVWRRAGGLAYGDRLLHRWQRV